MALIADDALSALRDRIDLLEIVSEHVVLKRVGASWRGLCPFHNEKSPSFYVHPEKGFFRCFGCGAGGNAFTFVMRLSQLSFPEAAEALADRYGVTIVREAEPDRALRDERARLKELHAVAAQYFQRMLAGALGEPARTYLTGRAVTQEMIERFGLGYAPPGWDGLLNELSRHGFTPGELATAGLVAERESGGFYDRFRDRLIFPIANERGETVAFGGRLLRGEGPKYLNSPETPLYNKSQILYGLHLAKGGIAERDGVLLVEGYLDVIRCHTAGFTHAVASSGTALTPQQAKQLFRHTPSRRVWLGFDADRAGQEAAARGEAVLADVARGLGCRIFVVQVPAGKDPDAFIQDKGPEAFAGLLAAAPAWTEYAIERALDGLDLKDRSAKAEALERLRPILRAEADVVMRAELVRILADRLGVQEETLRHGLWSGRRGRESFERTLSVRGAGSLAERTVLFFMGSEPTQRAAIRHRLQEVPFREPDHQRIWALMVALDERDGGWDWVSLLGEAEDVALHGPIAAIMDGYDGPEGKEAQVLGDSLKAMEDNWLKAEAKRVQEALIAADPTEQEALMRRLLELKERLLHGQHAQATADGCGGTT